MIHSGKLDRQITIEREVETVTPSGSVKREWQPVATVRAEIVQQEADEFLTGFGEATSNAIVFRIRYLAGITTSDRVIYDGTVHDIDAIAELGRRRALELKCKGVTA